MTYLTPAGNISEHQAKIIKNIIEAFGRDALRNRLRGHPKTDKLFDIYIELANKWKQRMRNCTGQGIPNLWLSDLQQSSANCQYATKDKYFYKFQVSSQADPLENDVLINCTLKDIFKDINHPFSLLDDYFILESNQAATLFASKSLPRTTLIPVIKSPKLDFELLGEFINNASLNLSTVPGLDFLANLTQSLKQLASLQDTIPGFTHNDLHLNNIMVDKNNGNIRIFDFGRAYIPQKGIDSKLVENIIKKLCLEVDVDGFKDFIYNQHKGLEVHQIRHEYGCYCEIASVVFSVVQSIAGFVYPSFFKVKGDDVMIGNISHINNYLAHRDQAINALRNRLQAVKPEPAVEPEHLNAYVFCFDALVCMAVVIRSWFSAVDNSDTITLNITDICDFTGFNNLIMQNGLVHPVAFKTARFTKKLEELKTMLMIDRKTFMHGGDSDDKQILASKGEESTGSHRLRFKFDTAYLDQDTFKKYEIEYAELLLAQAEFQNEASIPYVLTMVNRQLVSVTGGGSRIYRVYKDSDKKYIRKANKRVYLETVRGKYRYTSESKDSVIIK